MKIPAAVLTLMIAASSSCRADMLPDSVSARLPIGDVREVWLSEPTDRYRHFVLGGRFEAARINARTASGEVVSLDLPQDQVFEDRRPLAEDLDGDGRAEIVVTLSRQSTGSALAVLGLRNGTLKILAETPPNGAPNRWLNAAGIADFLGEGNKQIALVRMPHVRGRLELYSFDGRALTLRAAGEDASNHQIGMKTQGMAAVLPGHPARLAIPGLDLGALRILSFSGGAVHEDKRIALSRPAHGDITPIQGGVIAPPNGFIPIE